MSGATRNDDSPLVTVTLTTDEMAMVSAGLLSLRRQWAAHVRDLQVNGHTDQADVAARMVVHISGCKSRLDSLVSEGQGRDLLNVLISDLKRGPRRV